MRRLFSEAIASPALILSLLAFSQGAPCYALLIDDFSVDQVGISGTGPTFQYDALQSREIFGGNRVLWADAATTVNGGRLLIGPGTIELDRGNVSWNGVTGGESPTFGGLTADLTGYVGLEVEIAELTGTIHTRFSIGSGRNRWARKDLFFSTTGRHTIYFSSLIPEISGQPLLLNDVRNITFSTLVENGEFVAFDSVNVVPEPSYLFLCASFVAIWLMRCRRK
jgi:hypothetical protein